jgi:hypothetical protein
MFKLGRALMCNSPWLAHQASRIAAENKSQCRPDNKYLIVVGQADTFDIATIADDNRARVLLWNKSLEH